MRKTFIAPRKAVVAWVLGLFSFFAICISVYAAAGRCVPCRVNHYCPLGGIPYLCPADKPVTSGTGHDAQSDCMSCATRNGQGQPFFGGYHLGEGYECVSCVENDLTKPFWNGSECVACATADASKPVWNNGACEACPDDTIWDGEVCVANAEPDVACAFEIPHNGGTLCLVESIPVFKPVETKDIDADFLAKYGIVGKSEVDIDSWAGAMKYCQDKGYRLASMDELNSVANALYGITGECIGQCDRTSAMNCCNLGERFGLEPISVVNQALYEFLIYDDQYALADRGDPMVIIWANLEADIYALTRTFAFSYSDTGDMAKEAFGNYALCVK